MDIFSALADPTRRRILMLLAVGGTLSAADIGKEFAFSPPAISQHLKILRENELVLMQKQAQQRLYSLNPAGIVEMEQWLGQMRQFWNDSFDRLDALLQTQQKKD